MLNTLVAWLEANCRFKEVREDVLAAAKRSDDAGRDFHMAIAAELVGGRRAYLVQSYAGNLFVFALTDEQARHYGAQGRVMTFSDDFQRTALALPQGVVIDQFELEGSNVRFFEPIRGVFRYHGKLPLPENACLRVEMAIRLAKRPAPPARVSLFCYPRLIPDTRIHFQFTQAGHAHQPTYLAPQTTTAFLSVCIAGDPRQNLEPVRLSDTAGALVTLR